MIVKGSARKDGHALALYFMKSEEGARLIFSTDPMGDTVTAMTEWDEIGRLTRGEKPLYHMQLCPDAKYTVTDAQFKRMAEIVLEEIGATGHDYELYFHPGVKDNGEPDKPHAHLGVCRTNRDTLKMIDLSFNYLAHERASLRIAKEFGMEIVPGKHAKRDRKKQPEFPRAEATHDDHQQAERTGMTVAERKAHITALRQSCDDAKAFKAALEEAGYVLAKGDRRGFVLVDGQGETFSLSKHVTDIKGKDYKAFMAALDPATLPTVDEAKATQEQRQTVSKWESSAAAEKPGVEASKFLQPQPTEKQPEPVQAQEDAELEALKKALADRHAKEAGKWADLHAAELRQFEHELGILILGKTGDFDAMQQQARDALKARHAEQRKGIKGFLDAIQSKLNPTLAAEKAQQRRREVAQLKARQERERKDYLALLEQNRQLEIENLKERQALRDRQQEQKRADEQERYIREHHEAKRILADIEAERKELERNESLRDGPPPPKLGK